MNATSLNKLISLFAFVVLSLLFACEGNQDGQRQAQNTATAGPTNYPYNAVATVGMVGDIVRNVAGDKAAVDVIMGPGTDPHLYTASRDDVIRLNNADIVFTPACYWRER